MAETASFVEAAINANRDNFIRKTSAWAKADPLFSVTELDGAIAVFSGSSTDTFNVLALARDTERKAFDIIEDARSNIFGDNRFAVWSWQDGQLQALPVNNSAIDENLIMAAESDDLSEIPESRTPLDVTMVKDPQHLMGVGQVTAAIFGEHDEGFMVQSVFAGQDENSLEKLPTKFLLAYEGGKAVSTASYIHVDNVAGIYDVAVLPAQQKKGIGSRMFDAILAAAIRDGAKAFTLQASPDGTGIYERAGFQTLGICWNLDIS